MFFALSLAAAAPPDDIVVTGIRAADRARIAQAVRTTAAVPVDDQFARWNDPVCPRVLGVALPIAAIVTAKIVTEARAAGVKVGGAGCRTNIVVSFVHRSETVVASIIRRQPGLLAGLPAGERRVLLALGLPVRWWYGYDTRGSDGRAMGTASAALGANASGTDAVDLPARVGDSYHSSLISTKLRVDLTAATVLVDVDGATGTRLSAVAAYAARVALAPTRLPPVSEGVPTVLDMFGSTGRVSDLTAFDRAYLSALYRLPPDRSASTQRARLAAAIADRLGTPR